MRLARIGHLVSDVGLVELPQQDRAHELKAIRRELQMQLIPDLSTRALKVFGKIGNTTLEESLRRTSGDYLGP